MSTILQGNVTQSPFLQMDLRETNQLAYLSGDKTCSSVLSTSNQSSSSLSRSYSTDSVLSLLAVEKHMKTNHLPSIDMGKQNKKFKGKGMNAYVPGLEHKRMVGQMFADSPFHMNQLQQIVV